MTKLSPAQEREIIPACVRIGTAPTASEISGLAGVRRLRAREDNANEIVRDLANMLPYCYEDGCEDDEHHDHGGVTPDGSWNDDQAEDALTTMNNMIERARNVAEARDGKGDLYIVRFWLNGDLQHSDDISGAVDAAMAKREAMGFLNAEFGDDHFDAITVDGPFAVTAAAPEIVWIRGSAGSFAVDAATGKVTGGRRDVIIEGDGIWDYGDIVRVDLDEWRRHWKKDMRHLHDLDILDVGFWTTDGAYTEPEADWRKEFGVNRDDVYLTGDQPFTCPLDGARTEPATDTMNQPREKCLSCGTLFSVRAE